MTASEFQLTVACCREAFAGDQSQRIGELAARVDWPRFVRVVRFHRVQGLVWNSLAVSAAEVPAEVADLLSSDAREIAATNLRIVAEATGLRSAFAQAGIDLLFVKGLTVGALAYPKPLLKMGWDIDLLIAERDLERAAAELMERGYGRVEPADSVALASWHSREKESVWSRPDERLHVELHTRLADNRRLIPGIGLGSPRREVEVARGISLPTLAEDDLFAYLCVHGSSSLWFRLKWITDLAAILHRAGPNRIAHVYHRSQELGANRAAGQALLLADSLYGTLDDMPLRHQLRRDRASRRLAGLALRQLAGRTEPREPTETVLGTARIHLTQFSLVPGLAFKAGELFRQVGHHFAHRLARRASPG